MNSKIYIDIVFQQKKGFNMNKLKKYIYLSLAAIVFLTTCLITLQNTAKELNAQETQMYSDSKDTSAKYNLITRITLSKTSMGITKNKKSIIKAYVKYENNTDLENEPIIWSSKNPQIASVDKNGKIKALKAGKTYIICSSLSGNIKVRCKVTVREPYNVIKSINFDRKEMQLGKKDKRTLTPIIKYDKKTQYANEPVIWSSSNNKIATVKNGVIKGKKNGTAYIYAKSKYTNKSAKCEIKVKKTKYIAITFDDGPGDYTDKLLDALEKYHSKATFFILGNRVNTYKKQLKRAYNLGMEIGSHSYSHKNLKISSKATIKAEISKTRDAVNKIIGQNPTLFRPPYGNYNKTVQKYVKAPMIYWSVDTEDWKHKNAKYVSKYILNNAGKNQIILLHDIHPTSVDGFIKALPKLRKKGYELVTVSELYAIKGKTLKNGVMYYGPDKD